MKKILIETSARHVHLSAADIEALFGAGHTLTKKKDLSQPGEFACEERVDITGPKGTIKNVIVLGPVRKATQIEVSLTDARSLGVTAPVRLSGDVDGSAGCTITGSAGSIEAPQGIIAAKRHIHLTPDNAAEFGLEDRQVVCVKVVTDDRTTIFGDVMVRVHPNFAPAMHIDTDEANACGAAGNCEGEIIV